MKKNKNYFIMGISLIFLASFPAKSQQYDSFPKPYSNRDENGVDLESGGLSFRLPNVSIGPDHLSISYENWMSSIGIGGNLFNIKDNYTGNLNTTTSESWISAYLGDAANLFAPLNGVYRGGYENGTYLSPFDNGAYFIMKLQDSTEIRFDRYFQNGSSTLDVCYTTFNGNPNNPLILCKYLPTSISYRDGRNYILNYEFNNVNNGYLNAHRIVSVRTNFNYGIDFFYQNDNYSSNPLKWNLKSKVSLFNLNDQSFKREINYIDNGDFDHRIILPGGREWRFLMGEFIDGRPDTEENFIINHPITQIITPEQNWNIAYDSRVMVSSTEHNLYFGQVSSVSRQGEITSYERFPDLSVNYHTKIVVKKGDNSFREVSIWPSSTAPKKIVVKDELNRISILNYSQSGRLLSQVNPEGDGFELFYDDRFNLVREKFFGKPVNNQRDLSNYYNYTSSINSNFPCINMITCNSPESVVKFDGSNKNFTYDSSHGGVLSEMGPAPFSGGARPLQLTAWVQRYAWTKNSSGTLVQAVKPIWLKSSVTECQTYGGSNSPICDTGGPISVTSYEFGANETENSLLIKGVVVQSGGIVMRQCLDYDGYGNVISKTSPRANISNCE